MLAIHGVHIRRGSFLLRIDRLDIQPLQRVALVGPNGSGKSTLIQGINGLLKLSQGTIHWGGLRIDSLPPQRRPVGTVLQEPTLFPHWNVEKNLWFGLKANHIPKLEALRRLGKWSSAFDIEALFKKNPLELSGGEKQKVSLVRTLVLERKLLLLDEPLNHLDIQSKNHWYQKLMPLLTDENTTLVCATHDWDHIKGHFNAYIYLKDGQLAEYGEVSGDAVSRLKTLVKGSAGTHSQDSR